MTLPCLSLREDIIRWSRKMEAAGFVIGTSGNVSARVPDGQGFLITPSSLAYSEITPEDIAHLSLEGELLSEGRPPSSENKVHLKVYQARPDVQAVIHTHSLHASAVAALHIAIPAFLDELVQQIGGAVEVSTYAVPGTDELAENAVKALGERAAVLLANHGSLCVGANLAKAFHVVELLERTAQIFLAARAVGTPVDLPAEAVEMQRMIYDYLRTAE
jgi:L-fuculose-phosphate aldolase